MTRYLVATASGRTTQIACEYLVGKLEPDDVVFVLTVDEPGEPDDEAALDVAQAALSGRAPVRTFRRTGNPAREIVGFARSRDVDEIVVGPSRTGGVGSIGSTTRAVLSRVDVPVFVVPARST